ncbi:MAG: ribosome biogenesis GTPase Der [Alphaproteobacteria bacterium]|nr:ribosome biogenesis GTPase Der [Alphaproteobacteria bacterium]
MIKKVAIVGRPNVGKSTLFNRLVGKRLALVHDLPGVTRDRREHPARLADLRFNIIDTAGLDDGEEDELSIAIRNQTQRVFKDCDVLLFVVDAITGITPLDEHYADMVRRMNKPIIVLVNKAERGQIHNVIGEAAALGLGDAIAISAEHGEGLVDLYQALLPLLGEESFDTGEKIAFDDERAPLQLAIVGRPNVGKSTLINKLIKEDRLLTADMPGVTRDSITIDWEYNGRRMKLIDTAGIRKRSNVVSQLEKLSVQDALHSVDFAHVVVLVLDHETPLSKQDAIIANKVIDEGRVLIIAINKWDLIPEKEEYLKEVQYKLGHILPQIKGVPCIPISAKMGKNLPKLLDEVFNMYDLWNQRIPTAKLNKWLEETIAFHPPPIAGRSRIKFKYMTQVKTRPPTFVIFVSKPTEVPDSYMRYLQNVLRNDFDLPGVPLRIMVKSQENPYAE